MRLRYFETDLIKIIYFIVNNYTYPLRIKYLVSLIFENMPCYVLRKFNVDLNLWRDVALRKLKLSFYFLEKKMTQYYNYN